MATTSFHPFSRLPPELRNQIWEEAVAVERTVIIIFKREKPRYQKCVSGRQTYSGAPHRRRKYGVKYSYSMTSPLNNPNGVLSTLAANKESRAISLRHNGDILGLNRGPRRNRRTIHFNARRDAVFMDCHSLHSLVQFFWDNRNLRGVLIEGIEDIERLALPSVGRDSRAL